MKLIKLKLIQKHNVEENNRILTGVNRDENRKKKRRRKKKRNRGNKRKRKNTRDIDHHLPKAEMIGTNTKDQETKNRGVKDRILQKSIIAIARVIEIGDNVIDFIKINIYKLFK